VVMEEPLLGLFLKLHYGFRAFLLSRIDLPLMTPRSGCSMIAFFPGSANNGDDSARH